MKTQIAVPLPGAGVPPAASAHAALLLMVLIWGINFPVAKDALSELSPLAFNALRFPLAALVVLAALRRRGGFLWPARGDRLRVFGLGVLGNVFYQQFFIFGLALTRAGTASLLLAATPIMTALLSAGLGHEKVGARTWLGVIATFLGIALVVMFGGAARQEGATLLGDLLMIGASVSWAVYTVGSRPFIERYGSVQFTAWTLWTGAIGLTLIGLPAVLRTDLTAISAGAWFGVVYAGALSIGLAYLIWYYGVRQIGNTRTAAYSNLVPVIALIAAWLQLGEVPTAGQIVGAGVILAGITLAQVRVTRQPRS
ncbi:MAG TPA: DMT family transporter [Longimicrobiales bacterium]|nr:DMT family transporter [Longimicrobiales bacterium]